MKRVFKSPVPLLLGCLFSETLESSTELSRCTRPSLDVICKQDSQSPPGSSFADIRKADEAQRLHRSSQGL